MGRPCRNLTVAERRCRNAGCGACVGPFPFAAGFLVILSTPLAATLARSPGLRSDLAALRAVSQLVSRQGRKQGKLPQPLPVPLHPTRTLLLRLSLPLPLPPSQPLPQPHL